jgi:hypothetical protein
LALGDVGCRDHWREGSAGERYETGDFWNKSPAPTLQIQTGDIFAATFMIILANVFLCSRFANQYGEGHIRVNAALDARRALIENSLANDRPIAGCSADGRRST